MAHLRFVPFTALLAASLGLGCASHAPPPPPSVPMPPGSQPDAAVTSPPPGGESTPPTNPSPPDAATGPIGSAADASVPPTPGEQPPTPPAGDVLPACKRTVMVPNNAALTPAVMAALPGDCIILADGDYTFPEITKTATEAEPILIRAEHPLMATVSTGSIKFTTSSFVIVQGLTFKAAGQFLFTDSDNCRISRNKVQPPGGGEWVEIVGKSHHIRVDHNELGPRHSVGNIIQIGGLGMPGQVCQYTRIDHNYFHDVVFGGGNGWETIRAGYSYLAPTKSFTIIEYNLFLRAAGDPETISVKSSDNTVRYNTLADSNGQLCLRHGNRNQIYGNYIINSMGMRVCGADHKIYNNYFAPKGGYGIFLEGGDGDGTDTPGKQHYRVYRPTVVNNTIIGGGIEVGGSHPLTVVDPVIANNLIQGGGITQPGAMNPKYEGNIVSGGNLGRTDAEIKVANPMLTQMNGLWRLAAGSPAIDASVGTYDFVTEDIDGQKRVKADVGADEVSTDPMLRSGPLTEKDVGPASP
jgi:poly(beta-D-mannuronate) lyase